MIPATKKTAGFTIIEILVVLVLVMLVLSIITASFSRLNSSQALDKSAALVVSILNEARSLTFFSKDDAQYGVYLGESQIVLFKGATYVPSDPSNITTNINPLVGLRNIALSGGGTSVVFERLTGNTDEAGTMEIFLKASSTIFHTVTIEATGVVELD